MALIRLSGAQTQGVFKQSFENVSCSCAMFPTIKGHKAVSRWKDSSISMAMLHSLSRNVWSWVVVSRNIWGGSVSLWGP